MKPSVEVVEEPETKTTKEEPVSGDLESAFKSRMSSLRSFQEQFPHLGRFGAEQYEPSSYSYGEKLLPPDRVGKDDDFIFGIANIRRKDIGRIMRVYTKAEKQQGREISLMRWLKVYLWLTRSIDSKGAEQYIRLGPAGLTPVPRAPGVLRSLANRIRGV